MVCRVTSRQINERDDFEINIRGNELFFLPKVLPKIFAQL